MKRLARTTNRKIIMGLLSNNPISAKNIFNILVRKHEAGQLPRMPLIRRVWRTLKALKEARLINTTRIRTDGRQVCNHYSRRA